MRAEPFNDVVDVVVLEGRRVRLTFENGEVRDIDLARFLWGPAFEDIATDDELFRAVRVDPEVGSLVWPNGSDISPETLYRHSEPAARAS